MHKFVNNAIDKKIPQRLYLNNFDNKYSPLLTIVIHCVEIESQVLIMCVQIYKHLNLRGCKKVALFHDFINTYFSLQNHCAICETFTIVKSIHLKCQLVL